MQKENTIINPCQPYVELGVDDVSRLDMPKLGISHFYEFFLGNKLLHELKAVPDGSIDLLFNIGKSRVTTYKRNCIRRKEMGAGRCRLMLWRQVSAGTGNTAEGAFHGHACK